MRGAGYHEPPRAARGHDERIVRRRDRAARSADEPSRRRLRSWQTSWKPPVAIRITRPYTTEAEFLEREFDTMTHTTVVLLGAQARPQGVVLRFEIVLKGGDSMLRGEGRVVGYKERAYAGEPGLTLRFTRSRRPLQDARRSRIVSPRRAGEGVYVADVDACGGRPEAGGERPGKCPRPRRPPGAAAAAVAVTRAARAGVATRPSASSRLGPFVRAPSTGTLERPPASGAGEPPGASAVAEPSRVSPVPERAGPPAVV